MGRIARVSLPRRFAAETGRDAHRGKGDREVKQKGQKIRKYEIGSEPETGA
jgi:hypothetical protein